MTMQQIIDELKNLKQELDKIDLTKDMKPEDIKKMADKSLSHVDKITRDEGFDDRSLQATVAILGNASSRIAYDPTKDNEKARADKANRRDILAKVAAKKDVAARVKGKYDELTRKKAVIDKYKEKFDPNELTKRQNRKRQANENKIDANESRWQEVDDFKGKVSEELDTINNNLALMKELSEIEKKHKELQEAKADLEAEKKIPDNDKDFIAQYQSDVDKQEADFNSKISAIKGKYQGLKLDEATLEADIKKAKAVSKSEIGTAKGSINSKLTGAESTYGYKAGFESFIKGKLDAAKTDEEYLRAFDQAKAELEAENMNMGIANDKIQENIDTITRGQNLSRGSNGTSAGTTTVMNTIPDITEEQIQEMIDNDPECQDKMSQLNLPVDPKQMRQAVYKALTEGKKGPHPIAFLKSFSKRTQDQWVADKMKDVRDMAIRKINDNIQAKAQADANATKTVEGKREKFVQSLVSHVMSADDKTLEQMEKDADKAPGKVLTDVYKEVDEDSQR